MAPESVGEEIRRFEDQYRRNPEGLVFARLADAYRKAGDPERGLSVLRDGIARHPDYPSAHIVRARCLVDLDRPAEAERCLRRALELDGRNLVAIRGLAGLAEKRGDPVEAAHWFERIAALDPTNLEAETALGRLRRTLPNAQPGLEPLPVPREEWWSTPALEIGSHEDAVAAEPGTVPEPGTPEEGIRGADGDAWWFEDPSDEDPSDEGPADDGDLLTRTMADLYVRQGLLDEAAAIYRELLNDHPGDEQLLRALADVERRAQGPGEAEDEGKTPEPEATVAGDPWASHPVPATAATSSVFRDWLRRLSE